MNNLNPIYLTEQIKNRILKKAAKATASGNLLQGKSKDLANKAMTGKKSYKFWKTYSKFDPGSAPAQG